MCATTACAQPLGHDTTQDASPESSAVHPPKEVDGPNARYFRTMRAAPRENAIFFQGRDRAGWVAGWQRELFESYGLSAVTPWKLTD